MSRPAAARSPRSRADRRGPIGHGRSPGRHARYTLAVDRPTGGRTTTNQSAPMPTTGSTRSPRPRQIAGPSPRKNGTSLPSSAAKGASAVRGQFNPHPRLAATRAAAASLEPPPRPAAAGIRLTSRKLAPEVTPARWRKSSTARTTRFSLPSGTSPSLLASGPRVAGARLHSSSTRPLGSSLKTKVSYQPMGTMSVSISWNPSLRLPSTSKKRFNFAGA